MSLRSQMVADARAMIDADGDAVTLTAPGVGGAVYLLTGIYNRVGMDLDAEGQPIATDKSTLTVSLAALASAGLADPETLKLPGWRVDVADSTGITFTGRVDTPYLDRTLGVFTAILKKGAP